jgi:hypothetical protein
VTLSVLPVTVNVLMAGFLSGGKKKVPEHTAPAGMVMTVPWDGWRATAFEIAICNSLLNPTPAQ